MEGPLGRLESLPYSWRLHFATDTNSDALHLLLQSTDPRPERDMSERTHELAQDIARAYEREARLYADVLALSEAQRGLIRSQSDMRRVTSCVRRKQHLLDAIAEIEAKAEPLREEWDRLPETEKADAGKRLSQSVGSIQATMARIVEAEKDSEALLARAAAQSGATLAKLNTASRAAHAYRPQAGSVTPRFMDRTS